MGRSKRSGCRKGGGAPIDFVAASASEWTRGGHSLALAATKLLVV
jgi:hypothetical protein